MIRGLVMANQELNLATLSPMFADEEAARFVCEYPS
jgi:hypothetical protein